MTDREILDKYIGLDSLCLIKEERDGSNGNVIQIQRSV